MLVTDKEAPDLKNWVIKRLENISDADSEVLADYVLALIRTDLPDVELYKSAVENLEDFLRNNTIAFVKELLQAAKLKSYLPSHLRPPVKPIASGATFEHRSTDPASDLQSATPRNRKRPRNDLSSPTQPPDFQRKQPERHAKQAKRAGGKSQDRDFRFHDPAGEAMGGTGFMDAAQSMSFDQTSQFGAMMAFQQAMGMPVHLMAPGAAADFPTLRAGNVKGASRKNKPKARCKDYDTKGICRRGVNCPYLHDADQVIMPDDEESARAPTFVEVSPRKQKGRGRRGDLQERNSSTKRTALKEHRGGFDQSNTSLVVRKIPEENCSEVQIRGFFSAFGPIKDIALQESHCQAIVTYDNCESAQRAYNSPKAIFDNRFVKLYWHTSRGSRLQLNNNEDSVPVPERNRTPEPPFDREKFERESEAAQSRWEERKALKADTDAQLAELVKQKAALAEKHAEEKQKLEAKLQERGELPIITGQDKDSASTEALRAQLRALEEEARSLGLEPEPWASRGRGRGRGGFFSSRASPWSGRGAYTGHRGGHSFRGRGAGYGAFNLDNRPKRVRVSGVAFDAEKDEALRQHLTAVGGDFTSIDTDAASTVEDGKSPEAMTVAFKDRLTAERFFYGLRNIPGVGILEMEWVKNDPALSTAAGSEAATEDRGDVVRIEVEPDAEMHDDDRGEMDYDVADDEDRWA